MNADILAALSHMDMMAKHYEEARKLMAKHGIMLADSTCSMIVLNGGIDKLAEEIGKEPILTNISTPCKEVHHNGIEYFQYAKPKTEEYVWS